jgi:hypothetical protein
MRKARKIVSATVDPTMPAFSARSTRTIPGVRFQ